MILEINELLQNTRFFKLPDHDIWVNKELCCGFTTEFIENESSEIVINTINNLFNQLKQADINKASKVKVDNKFKKQDIIQFTYIKKVLLQNQQYIIITSFGTEIFSESTNSITNDKKRNFFANKIMNGPKISLSGDGTKLFAAKKDNTFIVWDITEKTKISQILKKNNLTNNFGNIFINFHGSRIYSYSYDKEIRSWDLEGNIIQQRLTTAETAISKLMLNQDLTILIASFNKTIVFCDFKQGKRSPFDAHNDLITCIDINSSGNRLVTASINQEFFVWNLDNKPPNKIFDKKSLPHEDVVSSVKITNDGNFIFTASFDKYIKKWNGTNGTLLYPKKAHNDLITHLGMDPNGKLIISCSMDNTIRFWNGDNLDQLFDYIAIQNQFVTDLVVSSDANYFITISEGEIVNIWDINKEKNLVYLCAEIDLNNIDFYGNYFIEYFKPIKPKPAIFLDARTIIKSTSNCPICNNNAPFLTESSDLDVKIECQTCGTFKCDKSLNEIFKKINIWDKDKYIISGYLRERQIFYNFNDLLDNQVLSGSNIPDIINNNRIKSLGSNQIRVFLNHLEHKQKTTIPDRNFVDIDINIDYPLGYTKDSTEFLNFINSTIEKGYIIRTGNPFRRPDETNIVSLQITKDGNYFIRRDLQVESRGKDYNVALQRISEAKKDNSTELSFEALYLDELPIELFQLTNLEVLNLDRNKLIKLPYEIGNFINLKKLNCSNNKLEVIPDSIGNLKQLKELYFYNNNLTNLPETISNLLNLEVLSLGENSFSIIPPEVFNLKALNKLLIDGNNIEIIPKEIEQLKILSVLNLIQNKIEHLPNELFNLKRLRLLALDSNNIIELPREILNLTSLEEINLRDNPIASEFEDGLLELNDLIEYFDKLERQETDNSTIKETAIQQDSLITEQSSIVNQLQFDKGSFCPFSENFGEAQFKTADDNSKTDDYLDRNRFSKAFANLIASKETKTPLVIGIFGPWGTGKSTLMEHIAEELKFINNLIKLKEDYRDKFNSTSPIWFNSWKYETQETVWAGLMQTVIEAYEKEFGSFYSRFFLLLEYNKHFYKTLNFWFTFIPLVLALLIWLYNLININNNLNVTSLYVSIPLLSPLFINIYKFAKPIQSNIQKYLKLSDYKVHLGLRKEIEDNFQTVIKVWTKQKCKKGNNATSTDNEMDHRLLILIDDLDRCSPDKAVQVLEALQLFLKQDGVITILGVEPKVLIKAICDKYKFCLDGEKESKDKRNFGSNYLEKIIQLYFNIPEAENIKDYLKFLLDDKDNILDEDPISFVEKPSKEEISSEKVIESKDKLVSEIESLPVDTIEAVLGLDQIEKDTKSVEVPENDPLIKEDPKEVSKVGKTVIESETELKSDSILGEAIFLDERDIKAFSSQLEYLDKNPRRLKKLVNIYKLCKYMLWSYNYNDYNPEVLAIWLNFSIKWPDFAFIIKRETEKQKKLHNLEFKNIFLHDLLNDRIIFNEKVISIYKDEFSDCKTFLTKYNLRINAIEDLLPLTSCFFFDLNILEKGDYYDSGTT